MNKHIADKVKQKLEGIKHGEVQIKVQDGKIVRIVKTESEKINDY